MYGGVRQALSELTHFEDIVQDGRVLYGDVGIWNSEVLLLGGRLRGSAAPLTTSCVRAVLCCAVHAGV
eukprot:COSAG01_NODE_4723_length_4791_cov_2.785806_2_plen_68_part_00